MDLSTTYQQAVAHHRAGRLGEAENLYRKILAEAPDSPEVLSLLASVLEDTQRPGDAVEAYRRITTLDPDDPEAFIGLGNGLRRLGDLDGAIEAYRRAVELRPGNVGALNNLANAVWDAGDLDQALALFRRAAASGEDPAAASNLLFALHFDPSLSPRQLRSEHERWRDRFAGPIHPQKAHANVPEPDRRLRIGYVSSDLHNHPVALFMLPLIENHDRGRFEITCYSDAFPDGITRHIAGMVGRWRDTRPLSNAQLAGQIRADEIDVLVDLSLHSRGSRLLTFARKPAPVQVTYLGYPSTSGLDTMDYRLSDSYLDPPGCDTSIYSEQTFRLPSTYWCYRPLFNVPEPGSPPVMTSGHVTFGSLNNFTKVGRAVLDTWRTLLIRVPRSRLILHTHPGSHRQRIIDRFGTAGIEASRIEFVGSQPLAAYFETYRRIDVALDPFPFPGATTTLDALWSGVPVVTLAGRSAASRAGVSILSNLGLTGLIAGDLGGYVSTATALAEDVPRLAKLRTTLRRAMQSSPLTDTLRFTRDVENAFREMWRRWCAGRAVK